MKKVKDEYFVLAVDKGWLEVKGDPVVMPGFEEYDLFVHCDHETLGFLTWKASLSQKGKVGSE